MEKCVFKYENVMKSHGWLTVQNANEIDVNIFSELWWKCIRTLLMLGVVLLFNDSLYSHTFYLSLSLYLDLSILWNDKIFWKKFNFSISLSHTLFISLRTELINFFICVYKHSFINDLPIFLNYSMWTKNPMWTFSLHTQNSTPTELSYRNEIPHTLTFF